LRAFRRRSSTRCRSGLQAITGDYDGVGKKFGRLFSRSHPGDPATVFFPSCRRVASPEAAALTAIGPATPDHTIFNKRPRCFVPLDDPRSPDAVIAALRSAIERFAREYIAYSKRTDSRARPRPVPIVGRGLLPEGDGEEADCRP
jgi:hypothetical protein